MTERKQLSSTARKIITSFVNPPIPWRHDDWFAYYDGDEPNDTGVMLHGSGATEAAAIADLRANADEIDESVSEPPASEPDHALNCSTRCRKQAEHKHPCDCGAEVKS